MKSAVCQCGHVMVGDDSADVAEQFQAHMADVHPDCRVPPPNEIRKSIDKAIMYGPKARVTFLLYPRDPEG